MADESWLTERMGEAIRECLEQGFELPVYAAIIASNGACAFFRFVDAGMTKVSFPSSWHNT
jgi:hypothetical protein